MVFLRRKRGHDGRPARPGSVKTSQPQAEWGDASVMLDIELRQFAMKPVTRFGMPATTMRVKTMLTRRLFCGCLAGGLTFAATALHAQSLECAVFTPDRQKSTAPDEAIARLKAGNERLTSGKSIHCDL